MASGADVLVTGVPRGGTTLVGALLDSLPDAVCLSEPPWHWHKSTGGKLDIGPDPTGEVFAKWLVGDFVDLRRRLLHGEAVMDRRGGDQKPLTNYYAAPAALDQPDRSGLALRPRTFERLSPGFALAIKHNGPYLTALEALIRLNYFTIIGVVRDPVDVIHSWQSLDLPVSRGKMHDAARCWPEMAQATMGSDVLKQQVLIYDLICQRLHAFRDHVVILRYEDVLSNPALVAGAIGSDALPDADLIDQPSRRVNTEQREKIEQALRTHGRHFRAFYPRAEGSG